MLFLKPFSQRTWGLLSFLALNFYVHANVTVFDGDGKFDVDADGDPEMVYDGLKLGVGVNAPSHTLQVAGNLRIDDGQLVLGSLVSGNTKLILTGSWVLGDVEQYSSSVSLSGNAFAMADSGSGSITLTLPTAASQRGKTLHVLKTDELNQVVVTSASNIDTQTSLTLTGDEAAARFFSDGQAWYVISATGSRSLSH
jgi:hypothetical protein